MFGLDETLKYHPYGSYINLGSGTEKLSTLAVEKPGSNPLAGDAYLFFSKDKTCVKILRWNIDGYILYEKRLERGTFELPRFKPGQRWIELEWRHFLMIMSGIPLKYAKFRKRLDITI